MMLNGGRLDDVRLLSPTIVTYMTSDHLDTIKPAIPTLQPGYGFGLGFAVRKANGVRKSKCWMRTVARSGLSGDHR